MEYFGPGSLSLFLLCPGFLRPMLLLPKVKEKPGKRHIQCLGQAKVVASDWLK